MKKISLILTVALLFLLATSSIFAQGSGKFPTLNEQLTKEYDEFRVRSGTALEQLIRDNQDFGMLRAEEATDKRGLPPWLRVWWRKNHPELEYKGDDPTGGYPLVLKEVVEWMYTHQDLKSGPGLESDKSTPYLLPDLNKAIGTNLRISGTQTAARSESDIRVNFFNPNVIISGSNNIGGTGRQGMYFSSNGGTTWGQSELTLVAGDAFQSDPTIDFTNDGRAYSSTLGINSGGSVLKFQNYFSTDNGATWTFEATASGAQTSVDKQLVWSDKSATSPFFGRQYAIWHNGAPAFANRRTAGAAGTWLAAPLQVSGAESTGTAIGSDIRTNANGDVFGFWPTTGNRRIVVVKSTTGGDTWGTPVVAGTTFDGFDIGIPAMANRRALIYTSGSAFRNASVNNVYVTWSDLSGDTGCTVAGNEPGTNAASACKMRIWFSRSTDGGATWSAATKINNQAGLNDQFNQAMAVDDTNGRIVIIYYDTVGDTTRKTTNVWMQSSTDNGATFSVAEKVTTATTDETISGADTGNQYGDYNGLSGYNSIFFPSWTDRRSLGREEIWTAKITFAPPPPPRSDFDGDGKTDLSVFRPSEGNWYLNRTTAGFTALNFGISTDTITPSDYDGDGKADLSVFRPSATAGVVDFYVLRSSNGTVTGVEWGTTGDQPVVADYDGDNKDDYAVWRSSTGTFWVLQSLTGTLRSVVLGLSTDKPVSADYSGDGKAEFAVFRPSTGVWYLSDNVTGVINTATFGISTDIPVYADYDGDGKEDIAVFRPSDGNWYTLRSSGGISIIHFGSNGDVPVPGDYDGDGRYDQAVYRNGIWYTNGTTSGVAIASFGLSTDRPTPRGYLAN